MHFARPQQRERDRAISMRNGGGGGGGGGGVKEVSQCNYARAQKAAIGVHAPSSNFQYSDRHLTIDIYSSLSKRWFLSLSKATQESVEARCSDQTVNNHNNNETFIKREPLVHIRARSALQKNKKYNLGKDSTS